MLYVGQEEIEALAEVIRSGKMFRYQEDGQCGMFEKRYSQFLNVKYTGLCSSGTAALTACLAGLKIGPGDEVIIPSHTYMATALAVLSVGAIPVIADIDESIMISPESIDSMAGPRTKAVIPVHMWGQLCDMDSIMEAARRNNLLVVEDACQCVGGFYNTRAAGTIGDAGAFSFNYFKNMTCGEGGAVVTDDDTVYERARCMIDPCNFYWEGRTDSIQPFSNCGSRASEFEGAMLNAQLDRIEGLIEKLRGMKTRILKQTASSGIRECPRHSPEGECAISILYIFDSAGEADAFAEASGGTVLMKTGRHTYTEWDQILSRNGSHHPALNPFDLPANSECRTEYSRDMLPRSIDILSRAVKISLTAEMTDTDADALADTICSSV